MESKTRVIGYVRFSPRPTRGELTIAAQSEKLRAYAQLHDLELVGIESDEHASGKTLNRPGVQRALSALENGSAGGLLVAKLDRLTRSVRDLGDLVEKYFADAKRGSRAGNFSLFSVGDHIDTTSAAGRFVLNVIASVAQWEREAIGERTRDGLAQLKRQGVKLGAAPLGERHSREVCAQSGRRLLEPIAAERATVARMVELRSNGATFRQIAATLTTEKHATRRGKPWQHTSVRAVLSRAA